MIMHDDYSLIRSVMPRGNGAYIVHSELAERVPEYELIGCNPYLASIPGLPHPGLRQWLDKAQVLHLSPNQGNVPLSRKKLKVVTFHSFDIDPAHMEQASAAQRLYYKHVLRQAVLASTNSADHIVAVSKYIADCIHQAFPNLKIPVQVIYNGIDTQRFKPLPRNVDDRLLRILFVGNPSRRKGFHLLEKLAEYLPKNAEIAFTSGLRNEKNGTADSRLITLGHVPHSTIHHLYQQADILIFPAYREGFGLCIAEAMASGLPVISSNRSAIPELIDEGRGGFLVDPDNFSMMLQRTLQLVADAPLRQAMGEWNRERALRDFELSRMVGEYRSLFASLL